VRLPRACQARAIALPPRFSMWREMAAPILRDQSTLPRLAIEEENEIIVVAAHTFYF
jgi:hypothetical protein